MGLVGSATAARQERQRTRAAKTLARAGISPTSPTTPIATAEAVEKPYVDIPGDNSWKKKNFWNKAGAVVSAPVREVSEKLENWVAMPFRGTIASTAYALSPGDIKGEEEYREKMSKRGGAGGWGALKAASDSFKESYPVYSTFVVDTANPVWWTTPGGVAGGASKVTTRAAFATKSVEELAGGGALASQALRGLKATERGATAARLGRAGKGLTEAEQLVLSRGVTAAEEIKQGVRAGLAGRRAQYAVKTADALDAVQHAEQWTMNLAPRGIKYVAEIAGKRTPLKYPIGRTQQFWSELSMKTGGKWDSRFNPFAYAKIARAGVAEQRAWNAVKFIGEIVPEGSLSTASRPTVAEAAERIRLFTYDSPKIMSKLKLMSETFPAQVKEERRLLAEAANRWSETAVEEGVDFFDELARVAGDDLDDFYLKIADQVRYTESVRIGATKFRWVATKEGTLSQGLEVGKDLRGLDEVTLKQYVEKGYIYQQKVEWRGDRWFQWNQVVKSQILYPTALVARPGYTVYNQMYNLHAILLATGLKAYGGMTGQGAGTLNRWVNQMILREEKEVVVGSARSNLLRLLRGKGFERRVIVVETAVPSFQRAGLQSGLTTEAMNWSNPAKRAFWTKLGALSEFPRAMQGLNQRGETWAHRVLFDTTFSKHFTPSLHEALLQRVGEGRLTLEQADAMSHLTGLQHADEVLLAGGTRTGVLKDQLALENLSPDVQALALEILDRDYNRVYASPELFREAGDKFFLELDAAVRDYAHDQAIVNTITKADNLGAAELDQVKVLEDVDTAFVEWKTVFPGRGDEIEELRSLMTEETRRRTDAWLQKVREFNKQNVDDVRIELINAGQTGTTEVRNRAVKLHKAFETNTAKSYHLRCAEISQLTQNRNVSVRILRDHPPKDLATFIAKEKKIDDIYWKQYMQAWDRHNKRVAAFARETRGRLKPGPEMSTRLQSLTSDEVASEIFDSIVGPDRNPYRRLSTVQEVKAGMRQDLAKIRRVRAKFKGEATQPRTALSKEGVEAVYDSYREAIGIAQIKATQDTQTFLFAYGNVSNLDYWLMHVSPFPFFADRHLLSMATYALDHPRKLAMFTHMVNNWYEMNKDMPLSQRLSIATEVTLPGGSRVLFRPLAWFQPTNYGIMQIIALGQDDKENNTVVDVVNTFQDFTGGFIYPQLEIGGGYAAQAVGLDRFVQNRYGVFRTPEEALRSLVPQQGLLKNTMATNKGQAEWLIKSTDPFFSLDESQKASAIYMLEEMIAAGEIDEVTGKQSAYNLVNHVADKYNTIAVERALGRDLWPKLVQYNGLPITAYTPGWQRSQMIQAKLQEGVPEGMERVYAPGWVTDFRKSMGDYGLSKYIPPRELSPARASEWRSTVAYWHGVDMARAEQKAYQLRLDEAYQCGEIDGPAWVELRQASYQNYNGAVELLAKEYPEANTTTDALTSFNSALGRTIAPVHPYRAVVEGYFAIELDEGYPPDYSSLAERRAQYMANLPHDQKVYLEWYITRTLTPVEQAYKRAVRTMQPYWNIEREVMEKRGLTALWLQVRNDQDAENTLRQSNPQYNSAMAEVARLRKVIRQAHPDIAEAGTRYWGLKPMLK